MGKGNVSVRGVTEEDHKMVTEWWRGIPGCHVSVNRFE